MSGSGSGKGVSLWSRGLGQVDLIRSLVLLASAAGAGRGLPNDGADRSFRASGSLRSAQPSQSRTATAATRKRHAIATVELAQAPLKAAPLRDASIDALQPALERSSRGTVRPDRRCSQNASARQERGRHALRARSVGPVDGGVRQAPPCLLPGNRPASRGSLGRREATHPNLIFVKRGGRTLGGDVGDSRLCA